MAGLGVIGIARRLLEGDIESLVLGPTVCLRPVVTVTASLVLIYGQSGLHVLMMVAALSQKLQSSV